MGEAILIVDDNPANARLVSFLLAGKGYVVRTAIDARDALAVLETFQPKLIMMDIQLPGMDGLTLARNLKANPRWQHVAIIALTAYAMKGDEERAKAAGCDGYVSKPIDTRTLPALVSEILAKRVG
jgi:CheY-like chemotaxis protein